MFECCPSASAGVYINQKEYFTDDMPGLSNEQRARAQGSHQVKILTFCKTSNSRHGSRCNVSAISLCCIQMRADRKDDARLHARGAIFAINFVIKNTASCFLEVMMSARLCAASDGGGRQHSGLH